MSPEEYTTKQLCDMYFATLPEDRAYRNRAHIDRKEVYEYEKKIGKRLAEMTSQEILDMMCTFINWSYTNQGSEKYKLSYRSYIVMKSTYKLFFDWYIDNIKIIKNPINSPVFKNEAAIKYISEANQTSKFTRRSLDSIIQKLHDSKSQEDAEYLEMFLLFFYDGFAKSSEIVLLKEEHINFRWKTATFDGKTVHMSDRLIELIRKNHAMEVANAYRGTYDMLSWHGSYVKFKTRQRVNDPVNEFEDTTLTTRCEYVSRLISQVRKLCDVDFNYRVLYLCGFYDWMCSIAGKKKIDEMILSERSSEAAIKLQGYANDYGVTEQNMASLKAMLKPFAA